MDAKGFWRRVEVLEAPNGCWLWHGANRLGYGVARWEARTVYTHRLAWYLTKGVWPTYLMHTCDRPRCVNPGHLIDADHKTNMADMKAKGHVTRGERNHHARLTEEQVRAIRVRISEGASQSTVAREFGVCRATIEMIHLRRSWAYLTDYEFVNGLSSHRRPETDSGGS
jgi:hypothetical protein